MSMLRAAKTCPAGGSSDIHIGVEQNLRARHHIGLARASGRAKPADEYIAEIGG
jgi:hypothetical protein